MIFKNSPNHSDGSDILTWLCALFGDYAEKAHTARAGFDMELIRAEQVLAQCILVIDVVQRHDALTKDLQKELVELQKDTALLKARLGQA
jgi:hypothetical protein